MHGAFDVACARVVRHLASVAPTGLWAVTRIVDGRQLWLEADAHAYPVGTGSVTPFSASLCRPMVLGEGPRIAPDVRAEPAYAERARALSLPVGAYVGTPIVHADGALFATVPVEQTTALVERMEKALEAAGVSGSFGHAPYSVVAGFPGAVAAADRAMYESKRVRHAARGGIR